MNLVLESTSRAGLIPLGIIFDSQAWEGCVRFGNLSVIQILMDRQIL